MIMKTLYDCFLTAIRHCPGSREYNDAVQTMATICGCDEKSVCVSMALFCMAVGFPSLGLGFMHDFEGDPSVPPADPVERLERYHAAAGHYVRTVTEAGNDEKHRRLLENFIHNI